MLDVSLNSTWQFIILAALTAATVIVMIFVYLKQRQRKALSYEIISRTPLLREEEVKEKLQILFNSKQVRDVYLIVARIINSGNVPIIPTDYERPFSLNFGKNTQILTAEISETDPDSLRPTLSIENTKVVLAPILMNNGDSIIFKMLVSQFDDKISVDARIVGVKDIKKPIEGRTQGYLFLIGMFLILIGVIQSFIRITPPYPLSEVVSSPSTLAIFLILFGYTLMGAGMFRSMKYRRIYRRMFRGLFE